MLVPLSWLSDFLPIDRSVDELNRSFNELGLVVEGVEQTGEGLDGIVTALVRSIRPHPNADKIRLVDVVTDESQTESLQVCCGAWNFQEGDRVPFATLGTTMPDGMKIERRKLRGEWSNGMLCSARELKIGDDHGGIMVLPPDTSLNVPIANALGIVKDAVFDLNIEANRPDAMSMVGVARDLAAKLKVQFEAPTPTSVVSSAPGASVVPGSISAPDLCDRLTVTVIRNVAVTESPDWIKSRLTAAGMRPINNLVDASNYVMLEMGAPSHAFDLDKLAGGRIGVRWAKVNETLVTLDGVTRTLGANGVQDGVIVDGDDVAVGVAAIMGGATSEVDDATRNLLLEIAHWTPMCIARSSKRLGLRSEASARFERGTDPEGLPLAAARFVELIKLTCPEAMVESFDDLRPVTTPQTTVDVRTSRINLVLGTELSDETIASLLEPIGFHCASKAPGVHEVTIPTWRPDATTEINIVEEVGRHFGYDNIARRTPDNNRVGQLTPYQKDRRRVANLLIGRGADEIWAATLVSEDDLTKSGLTHPPVLLTNPMVQEEAALRTSLLPGALRTLAHNANHRNPAIRLFELGHTFEQPRPEQIVPYEREHLAVALAADGDDAKAAVALFYDMVGALRVKPEAIALRTKVVPGLHPTRSAQIVGAGTGFALGTVGEVDPAVLQAWGIDRRVGWIDVDFENLCNLPKRSEEIASFSRFPSTDFDLAFVTADEVSAAQVERALRDGAGEELLSLQLFDVYRGERVGAGARSLAFRLRCAHMERTLTDADIAAIRQRCLAEVAKQTQATLRA